MNIRTTLAALACLLALLPAGARAGSCAGDATCPCLAELDFVPAPDGTTYVEVGLTGG